MNSGVTGGGGGGGQSRKKYKMMANGGPITGCPINRITQYRGYKDASVRLSLPVLPVRKEM